MAIAYVRVDNGSGTSGTTASAFLTSPVTGQLMIVVVVETSLNAIGAFTWPSGWTEIHNTGDITVTTAPSTAHYRKEVRYRVRESGDSGTSISITIPATTNGGWATSAVRYSGTDTTTPILSFNATTPDVTNSSTPITTPTLTSSVTGLWTHSQFSGFQNSSNRSFTSAGLSERVDGSSPNTVTYRPILAIYDPNTSIDASAGISVTGTPNSTILAGNGLIALMQPAVAAAPNSVGILIG